jgi:hypothetical protein
LPEEIIIDGLEEHAFRRSIEIMLRNGRADEAEQRLKALLPEVAGPGKVLPERLLAIGPGDIRLGGWDRLAAKVEEYSRPSIPITAVGIGIGDPSDSGLVPDAAGNLKPPLETTYYSDATFPFSETDRADLLEGYSAFGCEWQGDHDRADNTLSIEGIDDLYGAIARLENEVAASDTPANEHIRAGAIGACYLGVLVWQATRRAAIEHGLPRPLAILLVNSDAYPFFDAPVMTCEEYRDDGALQIVDHVSAASSDNETFDEPEETASLVDIAGLGAHRGTTKKMALVLEGDEAHNPLGMADELVAQAAFNPSSVDISRFMPDASDFRNEPDTDMVDPLDGWKEAPFQEVFEEPEYPVDALALPEPEPDLPFDEPAPARGLAETQDLPVAWPDENTAADLAGPEPDFNGITADFGPPAPDTRAETPEPPRATDTAMPWLGKGADLPFAPEPAANYVSERAPSHSIRSRIRVTATEEVSEPVRAGLFAAIARFFKRISQMLLRR